MYHDFFALDFLFSTDIEMQWKGRASFKLKSDS